jgi:hypothetical protein
MSPHVQIPVLPKEKNLHWIKNLDETYILLKIHRVFSSGEKGNESNYVI